MKLYYSATSPYVRKVMVTAIENGLDGKIEKVAAREPGVDMHRLNPLDKVPTFIADDGTVLIESALISQYLDDMGDGKLYPANGAARCRMLQFEALGHGVLDAAVLCRMEERIRKPEMRSAEWLERQQKKIGRGLDAIEQALDKLGPSPTAAHVTYGCMLFFIDQHKLHEGWRDRHPKLAAWYEAFRKHPSMAATEPTVAH